MGGAFGVLLRGLTEAGVVLLLFVPGIRVVQHSAEREHERSIKKRCCAAAEAVPALQARLKQVILRIRMRREPGPRQSPLQSLKGRLNKHEASLPEICPLTERRTLEVGSLKAHPVKAHRPCKRHPTKANTRRERRLTKVGILRECRVSEVRVLREFPIIARPRQLNKRRLAKRGVAVELSPTKICEVREGRPAKVRRARKARVEEHRGLLGGYTGKARGPAEKRIGEYRGAVEDRRGEVCFIVERGGGE